MTDNSSEDVRCMPYKEIVKKRTLDYYYAIREEIRQKQNNRCKSLSPEQKKKRQEQLKQWFHRQTPERQAELRQKAQEYNKNRYNNLMVAVSN